MAHNYFKIFIVQFFDGIKGKQESTIYIFDSHSSFKRRRYRQARYHQQQIINIFIVVIFLKHFDTLAQTYRDLRDHG
jgi:hypothetical protein